MRDQPVLALRTQWVRFCRLSGSRPRSPAATETAPLSAVANQQPSSFKRTRAVVHTSVSTGSHDSSLNSFPSKAARAAASSAKTRKAGVLMRPTISMRR